LPQSKGWGRPPQPPLFWGTSRSWKAWASLFKQISGFVGVR